MSFCLFQVWIAFGRPCLQHTVSQPSAPAPCCRYGIAIHEPTFVPNLVHHLDNNVDFIHSSSIEVLSHSKSKLLFRHTSLVLPPRHRRALPANPRIREERLVPRRGESCRYREVVCNAVAVQQLVGFFVPDHLHRATSVSSICGHRIGDILRYPDPAPPRSQTLY